MKPTQIWYAIFCFWVILVKTIHSVPLYIRDVFRCLIFLFAPVNKKRLCEVWNTPLLHLSNFCAKKDSHFPVSVSLALNGHFGGFAKDFWWIWAIHMSKLVFLGCLHLRAASSPDFFLSVFSSKKSQFRAKLSFSGQLLVIAVASLSLSHRPSLLF